LQHPPSWQAQNTVHERFALLQPHLDELQGVPLWHPHLMGFRTESGARFTASVIVVGTSDLLTSSFFYLYFSTSNSGWSSSFADRQIDAWWWARFTFSTEASVAGGSEHSVGVDTCSLPVLAAHAVNRAFDIVSHFLSVIGWFPASWVLWISLQVAVFSTKYTMLLKAKGGSICTSCFLLRNHSRFFSST